MLKCSDVKGIKDAVTSIYDDPTVKGVIPPEQVPKAFAQERYREFATSI